MSLNDCPDNINLKYIWDIHHTLLAQFETLLINKLAPNENQFLIIGCAFCYVYHLPSDTHHSSNNALRFLTHIVQF